MNIFRNILVVIFLLFFTYSYSQSIDAIKKKNAKTEKEIAYLNKLLENARKTNLLPYKKFQLLIRKSAKEKR